MLHWVKFNLVGLLGFALQTGVIFVLTHSTPQVSYLAATATAVELAVLNNFVWHQHWTWKDRPAATRGETLRRLVKFNITNGAVSIIGNLIFMSILVGRMGLPITGANVASVSACSICNFFLADRIAFHAERSRRRKHFLQSEPHTVPVSPYFGNDKVERSCRLIFIPKESRHMDPDPMQFVEDDNDKKDAKAVLEVHKSRAQLNTLVDIAVD